MRVNTAAMKRARIEAGLSLRGLATATGMAHDSVMRIEAGRQAPYPATVKKIADALGVPVASLIVWEDGDLDLDGDIADQEHDTQGKAAAA